MNKRVGIQLLVLGCALGFLASVVHFLAWGGAGPEVPRRPVAAAVITVMCVGSFSMLMRVAYAGLALTDSPSPQAKSRSRTEPAWRATNNVG